MKIETAYIISYLPDDELRTKRKEIHSKQLEYWLSKNINCVVYAQGYHASDFSNDSRVDYIVNVGSVKRPAEARNELLKVFYSSDEDFGLFLDNDIVLYPGEKYMDSETILDILKEIPIESMTAVDVFEPLNPTQTPFTEYYNTNRRVLESSLIFKRHPHTSGGSLFIKNFMKHSNQQFFFDDWKNEDGSVRMGEDVAFGINLTKQGKGCYTLMNIVRKDMGWNSSSWCKTDEDRKKSFLELKKEIVNLGVDMKKGKLDWSGLGNRYNIPREVFVDKQGNDIFDLF